MDDLARDVAPFVRRALVHVIAQADAIFAAGGDEADVKGLRDRAQAGRAVLGQLDLLIKLSRQVAQPADSGTDPGDPAEARRRILDFIAEAERRVSVLDPDDCPPVKEEP